jgi:hypothetical protein|tara:strand:+ start:498 stop:1334 length:837 start_codon:yes stop_codon:yes gene_type:complete
MALGTSKPVCYYQFENNAYDDSNAGNTMDGTLATGGSYSTVEKVRGSYSFLNSDTGGVGCIHSCGTVADMGFFWTGVWTLSFWINRNTTLLEYAMGNQVSGGSGKYGFAVKLTSDALSILMYPGGDGSWVNSASGFGGETGDTGNWHHLVITSDASTIKFYGDGAFHSDGQESYSTWPGATDMTYKLMLGSIAYGSDSNPWTGNYLGYMDEVSIWDATATADEVASLYNGGASRDLRDGLDAGGLPDGINYVGGIPGGSVKTIVGVNASSVKKILGLS